MKKELTVKIGFDTCTETSSDITKLILGIIEVANDGFMYVVESKIENEIVFDNGGFKGQLRKTNNKED